MRMNKLTSLLPFINLVLVSVGFPVLSRRSWKVLCWGNYLSAGLADMRRQSPSFWKGPSHLQLLFHLARWWRRGWAGQQIDLSGFAFRTESFIQGIGAVYSSWLFLLIESVVIRCGMRSLPTIKCAQVHGWC